MLWRKLPGARSAGRVQSVALRLVCDRELEIEKFVAREYWSLVATLATPRSDTFEARLVGADGKKIQRLDIGTGAEAEAFKRDLETAQFTVASVEAKPGKRNPPPPFTTSTLQQEASRKLGFAPAHTMRVAQRLYEGVDIGGETVGLITYMRTDGVQMAPRGDRRDPRRRSAANYGKQYVPERAAPLPDQAEERAGSARGDPPDRPRRAARATSRKYPRCRPGQALRADLDAHDREPDGIGRARAHHRRHRRARPARASSTCAPPARSIKFDGFLTLYQEGQDDDARGRRVQAPARDERRARRSPSARSPPPSISPSRRRASPKPRWSSAWKSSASAGPRPMRRSCRC